MGAKNDQDEERGGVRLTNLDQELFPGGHATKRDLVDYLDAVRGAFIPVLAERPLSVVRVLRGQAPFMQKNVPRYTPDFVRTVTVWAESSRREVAYALCNDRQTLLWFANQRAVEYHPTLMRAGHWDSPEFLVLDIDPPAAEAFGQAVAAASLVREALESAGLQGAVKTSGAKGVHVVVPLAPGQSSADAAAATRAIAAAAEKLGPELATTTTSRSPGSRRCMKASAGPGRAARNRDAVRRVLGSEPASVAGWRHPERVHEGMPHCFGVP